MGGGGKGVQRIRGFLYVTRFLGVVKKKCYEMSIFYYFLSACIISANSVGEKIVIGFSNQEKSQHFSNLPLVRNSGLMCSKSV